MTTAPSTKPKVPPKPEPTFAQVAAELDAILAQYKTGGIEALNATEIGKIVASTTTLGRALNAEYERLSDAAAQTEEVSCAVDRVTQALEDLVYVVKPSRSRRGG